METSDNYLGSGHFNFTIDRERGVTLLAQKVTLPDVSLTTSEHQADFEVAMPSDRMIFGPFTMTFIIDENLDNWKYLFGWMRDIIKADDAHLSQVASAQLTVYNRKNTVTKTINFNGVFPINISGIQFDYADDTTTMFASATFEYTHFDFEA